MHEVCYFRLRRSQIHVIKLCSGVSRCRDMRVRDVRQAAPEHGAGPREDRTPTHRQNRRGNVIKELTKSQNLWISF